jgi:hypothetical protein
MDIAAGVFMTATGAAEGAARPEATPHDLLRRIIAVRNDVLNLTL